MADQCPPGFTEYNLGTSRERDPLRFHGRILAKAERVLWHRVAASAVPADAWRAFQAGATLPD